MKIINRKAFYDYDITDKLEAGVVLSGPETKSTFAGKIRLEDSYVKIIGSEAFLINAHIFPYEFATNVKTEPTRTRKLLLHTKEIISLKTKLQQSNLTLVPLAIYTKGKIIKLEIGIGKGKKKWDKRETIKQRELKRKVENLKKN